MPRALLVDDEASSLTALAELIEREGFSTATATTVSEARERSEAEIEGSRLELETALLRARQDVSRTERDILEFRNKRHNEVLAELRQTQEKLEDSLRRTSTAQKLLNESDQFAAQFATAGSEEEDIEILYSIVRKQNGALTEKAATDTSSVEPGDLVKVRIIKRRQEQISSRLTPVHPAEAAVAQVP